MTKPTLGFHKIANSKNATFKIMSPSRSPRNSAGVCGATLATKIPVRLPPDIRMPTPPCLRNETYRGSDLKNYSVTLRKQKHFLQCKLQIKRLAKYKMLKKTTSASYTTSKTTLMLFKLTKIPTKYEAVTITKVPVSLKSLPLNRKIDQTC